MGKCIMFGHTEIFAFDGDGAGRELSTSLEVAPDSPGGRGAEVDGAKAEVDESPEEKAASTAQFAEELRQLCQGARQNTRGRFDAKTSGFVREVGFKPANPSGNNGFSESSQPSALAQSTSHYQGAHPLFSNSVVVQQGGAEQPKPKPGRQLYRVSRGPGYRD